MKYVKLIIFDLDGTLVDSKEAIAEGINFMLTTLGLQKKSVSQIASYIGKGIDYLIKGSLGPGKEDLFEQGKAIFENYRKQFPDSSPLYPGVKEILEHFKNKKKAILTNRKREFALISLKELGILDYFDDIAGEDDAVYKKPSSCPLDRIISGFQVDKKEAIMVGDMDIDILTGKSAGIASCAVTYGIGKKEDILKVKPDFIIDDIAKLKRIVN